MERQETIDKLRLQLNKDEQKIFDSILRSFPSTQPESAYSKALEGGATFQFICK
jgi:hypothetical protein